MRSPDVRAVSQLGAEHLRERLDLLRGHALDAESRFAAEVKAAAPQHERSARNLIHYLALRGHDLRELQHSLAELWGAAKATSWRASGSSCASSPSSPARLARRSSIPARPDWPARAGFWHGTPNCSWGRRPPIAPCASW